MSELRHSAAPRIRPAQRGDVATILALVRELAAYERLLDHITADEANITEALFGKRPSAEALVVEMDGRAVGYACFFTSFSSFLGRPGLYVEDIYVQPASRGHGAGLELMRAMARLAVDRGCGRMEWSVLDWNAPAIDFYRRLGAEPMTEWTIFRLTGDGLTRLATNASNVGEP